MLSFTDSLHEMRWFSLLPLTAQLSLPIFYCSKWTYKIHKSYFYCHLPHCHFHTFYYDSRHDFSVTIVYSRIKKKRFDSLVQTLLLYNLLLHAIFFTQGPLSAVWPCTCCLEDTSSDTSWTFCPWHRRLLGSGNGAGCRRSSSLHIWFLGFGRGRLDAGQSPH